MKRQNHPLISLFLASAMMLQPLASFAQPLKAGPKPPEPAGPVLTILDYLDQVAGNHDDFKSARESTEAAKLRAEESHLLISPNLFGNVQHTDDAKASLLTPADKSLINVYQLGVSEQTSIGLSGRLYYSVQDMQFKGLVYNGTTQDFHMTQASPVLELTMPLWRNWWGGETMSQVEQGDALAAQSLFNQSFRQKNILVQSAMSYWNLALSRETIRISQDSVERNQQLVKWQDQRARNGLGDRSDLLQAQAALQNSQINLKISQDAEVTMRRAFNLARGRNSTEVPERLMPLTDEYIDRLKIPVREELRDDVKAAREQTRAATVAAELSRQRYLPTLELYGSYALNNNNPTDTGAAYDNSFRADRPTEMIGIRLTAPLELKLISDTRQGWAREKIASDLSYRRKLLEQDGDWNDLVDKFAQAHERFRMYQDLEKTQKEKFDNERTRRTAGRTTTQQVLLFETDYELAQLSRIRSLSDMFLVYAQMKLYEGVKK